MPQCEVRRLGPNDVEAMRKLLKICWVDTYTGILPASVIRNAIEVWQSKESILRGVKNAGAFYAGCMTAQRLCGIVSAGPTSAGSVKIFQLYVLPSMQRQGIGSRLLDAAIAHFEDAARIHLEVEQGNEKGISFYKKYGFTQAGTSAVAVGDEKIPCMVFELMRARRGAKTSATRRRPHRAIRGATRS